MDILKLIADMNLILYRTPVLSPYYRSV